MGWSSNCIKRNLHQSLLSTSKTKSNRHQKVPPPPRCTQSALKQNRTSSSTCEHLLWRKEDVWDRSPLCSRWIRWVDLPASVLMSSSASLKVEADLIKTSSMQHHDLIRFFFYLSHITILFQHATLQACFQARSLGVLPFTFSYVAPLIMNEAEVSEEKRRSGDGIGPRGGGNCGVVHLLEEEMEWRSCSAARPRAQCDKHQAVSLWCNQAFSWSSQ